MAFLYSAWNDTTRRRLICIAWDIGTFWPRSYHPLAPPCYTERAIPELLVGDGDVIGGGVASAWGSQQRLVYGTLAMAQSPAATAGGSSQAGGPAASKTTTGASMNGSTTGGAMAMHRGHYRMHYRHHRRHHHRM